MTHAVLPHHIAIVMDGNGRWAQGQGLPRVMGHQAGVRAVREIIEESIQQNVAVLTLFAFSSENWRRPVQEVSFLMDLFTEVLQKEIDELHAHGVKLRIVGDTQRFSSTLKQLIQAAEEKTLQNNVLTLNIAVNYGGRWDVLQALQRLVCQIQLNQIEPKQLTDADIAALLVTADLPDPDLLIRTGGEQRISNFMLWQLAYTELYFTETLWPEFNKIAFQKALAVYSGRQRRFGHIGEQIFDRI